MSVSNLNVRVGFLFDEKGLKQMERSMRAAGQRLSNLGNELTTSFTLPLAAIGAAAFKSAGDIESLQLAMESQLGSAEAARKEIELLRKEALKPGLGFEQAVRGSVSLQAVGFSAEKAREVISRFGNALALAGKGGAELDGVVLALTQIKAKGIVSAEEINQIAERLPQIRTLMQQAFGTASTEAIQKLGITADQFITGITEQMKGLPQAAGGIKNSLENFFDALKNGAAKLGLAIQTAFDVTGKLESFAAFVSSAADGFASLNPAVQDFVLGLGLVLAVAGPVAKWIGALQLAGAQVVSLWGGMVSAAKGLQLWLLNVASAFRALNLATQSFILIGVALAIAGIVTQLGLFDRELTAVEKAQSSVNELVRESASAVQAEKTKVGELVKVVENQNAKYEERKKAIEALKRISPEYFGQLSLEKSEYGGLTTAVNGYIKSLVDAETVRRAVARKAEIEIEKQNAALNTTTTLWQDVKAAAFTAFSFGTVADAAARGVGYLNENVAETKTRLEAEDKLLDDVIAKHGGIVASTDKLNASTVRFNASLAGSRKLAGIYKEVLSDIANVSAQQDLLGAKNVVDQAEGIESGIKKLLDAGFKPASAEVQNLKTQLQGLFTGIKGPEVPQVDTLPMPGAVTSAAPVQSPLKPVPAEVLTSYQLLPQYLQAWIDKGVEAQLFFDTFWTANGAAMKVASDAMVEIAAVTETALSDASTSWGSYGASVQAAILKAVSALIKLAVAQAVTKAFKNSPNPLLGAALAALAGSLAAGVFNRALAAAKVPGFAKGTNFAPGGLALVGEKGAELVNLPRGSQVTPNNQLNGMMGGGVNVSGTFRIQGTDLVVVLEKAQKDMRRTRGF